MILRKWHPSHVRLCAFMCVYASCVRACVLMFRSCSFCARRTSRSHSYTCITTAPCLVFGGLESSGLPVECVRILTGIVACISVCVYVSVCMSVCLTVIFRYCLFQGWVLAVRSIFRSALPDLKYLLMTVCGHVCVRMRSCLHSLD